MSVPPTVPPRWARWLASALLALAAVVVYWNSLWTPFVFDDELAITQNDTIKQLWPLWTPLAPPTENAAGVIGRPLVNLSLALNYALSGTHVFSYHLANLLIHIGAGLALFGIVRRTFLQPVLKERWGELALPLAFLIALLWTVHPLQTESVTCVIQRTESMVGLFYFLALYGFVRACDSPRPRFWLSLSVVITFFGMATKEVMATAPVLIFLYDRTFIAGTFRAAIRARGKYYLGLASAWLLLAWLMLTNEQRGGTVGFGLGVSSWDYLLTQCQALVMYIKLAFWPSPLVLDYGTDLVTDPLQVWPQAVLLIALAGATGWALWRQPMLGFLGAWFFLIIAPSSSLVPLKTQTMAEHRMYLPLLAIVVLVALGCFRLMGKWAALFGLALAALFGWMTIQRNHDYRSGEAIWSDAIAKRPENYRAHYNLGTVYGAQGRVPDAIEQYQATLATHPDDTGALNNLGILLALTGNPEAALKLYHHLLEIKPEDADGHYNLGNALIQLKDWPTAIAEFQEALRLDPSMASAANNLGIVYLVLDQNEAAAQEFSLATHANPAYAEAHYNLANTLVSLQRPPEAIAEFRAAIQAKPDYADAYNGLGLALGGTGDTTGAIAAYGKALEANPDFADAKSNLAAAYVNLGNAEFHANHFAEAAVQYQEALHLQPANPEAHNNLAGAYLRLSRYSDAVREYQAALNLKPDYADARKNLELIQGLLGTMGTGK